MPAIRKTAQLLFKIFATASAKTWQPSTMSESAVFSVKWCEMPPIDGLAIMTDADDTREHAQARYGDIVLKR